MMAPHSRSSSASLGAAAISAACFIVRLLLSGGGKIDLVLSAGLDKLAGAEGSLPSPVHFVGLTAIYALGGAALGALACLATKPNTQGVIAASGLAGAAAAAIQILLGGPVHFG